MKYMVMVNNKYMVQVENDGSNAAAEHMILDNIYGVKSALSFDAKAMKTEYFVECMMMCEVITLDALKQKSENMIETARQNFKEYKQEVADIKSDMVEVEEQIRKLNAKMELLKIQKEEAEKEMSDYAHALANATGYRGLVEELAYIK